jgi:hypothetical protein
MPLQLRIADIGNVLEPQIFGKSLVSSWFT